MTKGELIRKLYGENKTVGEIVAETGAARGYVHNVLWDLKKPGAMSVAKKNSSVRPEAKKRQADYSRQWRKDNPEKRKKYRKEMLAVNQAATRPVAHENRRRWAEEDAAYLAKYGEKKTIREIACTLGRTYAAVETFAQTHGISLKGDKMDDGSRYKRKRARPAE